jgi:hypothetical protein
MPITTRMMTAIEAGSNAMSVSPGSADNSPLASTPFSAVPARIAPSAPIALPRNPMNTASRLNRPNTRPAPIPIAFMSPISRVRSCTLMRRVFTMPKPAAIRAITAKPFSTSTMASMTVLNDPIWSSTVVASYPSSFRSLLIVDTCSSDDEGSKRRLTEA